MESTPHMYNVYIYIYICPSYWIIRNFKCLRTYGEEEDSELSELEILLYEEPRGKGSEDDTDEGHTVGRDIFSYPGMVNSQVGQGLVNELYRVATLKYNIKTLAVKSLVPGHLPGPHSATSAASQ